MWQPIETAPKDGTEVIVYGIRLGDWGYTEDKPDWTGARYINGHWTETKPTPRYCNGFKPTHWLPLPDEPSK